MNITPEQKDKLISLLISTVIGFIVAAIGILGFNIVVVQPQQAVQDARMNQLKNELGFEDLDLPVPGQLGVRSLAGGLTCKAGSGVCLKALYGRDLIGYSDSGSTEKWKIEGSDGSLTHSGYDILTAATTISLTNGGVIRPTGSFQPLSAAGNVTLTMGITVTADVTYTNNTVVLLYNTANVSILIADSGNFNGTTAITLGQYDILAMRYDAASATWVELYTANS